MRLVYWLNYRELESIDGSSISLMHCTTLLKPAGLIPFGVVKIFRSFNNCCFAIAVGFFQPLMKRCTRHMSWGVKSLGA